MMLLKLVVLVNSFGAVLGWHLVMKVPKGNLGGASSVYDLWTSNMTLNPDAENVMNIQPGIPYKSADTLDWENKSISLVKIAFYSGVEEVAYIVFGAAGHSYNHSDWPVFQEATNNTSWFDCSRILYSTFSGLVPDFCSLHSVSTLDHSFSILSSPIETQTDCINITGWFTVLEPGSVNSAIQCPWQPTDSTPPYFMFSHGNSSVPMRDAVSADVFAIYVDDCIDETVCHSPECWQNPYGDCFCNGYKCTEACSHLPCSDDMKCVTNPKNESSYTCECLYGYIGDRCKATPDMEGLTAAAIAGIVIAVLLVCFLVTLGIWYFCRRHHKDEDMKQGMTQRAAGSAKDFVRRSVHRLSGRQYQFQRRHLKEEKPSPTIPVKGKSEQLSPDSSVVFGEVNPAFMNDEPATPQPTPPVDRRYTEFPTRQVPPASVSVTEIQLHDKKQQESKLERPVSGIRRYENLPFPQSEVRLRRESPHNFEASDRASTIGSFEKASTMSEISDATSTSGYSDYTGDTPANLPPSEMISKDVIPRHHGHYRHKARSRPRSRASTAEPPKLIAAPETREGQISYAMERSRLSISSLSSMSSEATHKSDSTQRSGELTKSDVLRARYEHVMGFHGEPAGRLSRFDHVTKGEGPSYSDIKRQLDADMSRREARERKLELEQENETKYDAEKAKKHRMRQVESLDSGIDAENNTSGDRNSDGRIQIIRARSADQLDRKMTVSFSSKEATV